MRVFWCSCRCQERRYGVQSSGCNRDHVSDKAVNDSNVVRSEPSPRGLCRYDNEWGYSCRMAKIGKMVIDKL
jgi:glyceraldehyde-3-phosphate dehydrogenase/erythrose-4-phosphate dehydrogenase